eukprot:UN28551
MAKRNSVRNARSSFRQSNIINTKKRTSIFDFASSHHRTQTSMGRMVGRLRSDTDTSHSSMYEEIDLAAGGPSHSKFREGLTHQTTGLGKMFSLGNGGDVSRPISR